jgi:hypothetical protein
LAFLQIIVQRLSGKFKVGRRSLFLREESISSGEVYFFSLKGWNRLAQGNALGSVQKNNSTLKVCDKPYQIQTKADRSSSTTFDPIK